jgi:hypothetical protein
VSTARAGLSEQSASGFVTQISDLVVREKFIYAELLITKSLIMAVYFMKMTKFLIDTFPEIFQGSDFLSNKTGNF